MIAATVLKLLPLVVFTFSHERISSARLAEQDEAMSLVRGGRFEPTIALDVGSAVVQVDSYWLDRDVVTNGDFLAFVVRHPAWQRGRVSPLFAGPGYLAHWSSASSVGPGASARQPVVNVSWFAAKAFCEARGARLPSELEWEYASAADERQRDARKLPAWRQATLDWYARPAGVLPETGSATPNYWGVRDLHGLVWEWVLDFNAMLAAGDSRAANDAQMFCGAGATTQGDRQDYAAFMRMAFFTSLQASHTAKVLGFRCARTAGEEPPS